MAEASRLAVEADADPPGPGIPVTGKVVRCYVDSKTYVASYEQNVASLGVCV